MSKSVKLEPGTVLADRYELAEKIGQGGFGAVWRATQMNMDREVAVKVLPPQFMTLEDVVERFKREARLASRLRHPNTITLHDYGQQNDLLYIVMELLTGEDLADVLKEHGKLPADRIIHIARQVLKSLAEAHEQNIVHRDLKPENIFLSVVGEDRDFVKVLDFGIAKLLHPEGSTEKPARRLTMSGSTVGTPTYMSPEQAAGEDVNHLTDLYALGVIMYETYNGRPPFYSKDPVKIMRAHLFDVVPPLRDPSLRGTLLDRVIQKALQKDPRDRFQSASDMLLALAGQSVAQPVVHGVSLSDFDEPSGEFTLAPNTDDVAARRQSTLTFAGTPSRESAESDEIPFDAIEGRAKVTETASGSSSSSIVTVIDEPVEGEVILLTRKKDEPLVEVAAQVPEVAAEPEAERPKRKPMRAVMETAALPPAPAKPAGSWGWTQEQQASPKKAAARRPQPKKRRNNDNAVLIVLLFLVAIAAVVLVLSL